MVDKQALKTNKLGWEKIGVSDYPVVRPAFCDITGHFVGVVAKELTWTHGKPTMLYRWATGPEIKIWQNQ